MKRSEFYAFFIVMIICFTASMSWAVSYQPQIIQPTKPYKVNGDITAASGYNTYNTVVNITGRGILSGTLLTLVGNNIENDKLFIKTTIDGVAYEYSGASTGSEYPYSFTASGGTCGINNSTAVVMGPKTWLSIQGPIYFKTSLKVEVKQTGNNSSAGNEMHVTVNYATE